ncbi:hypothetical protein GCK72_007297 [Caenorhabditis remanei]|uniref:L-Fucosyltransferase n=1 Tax=Caenorhabditis remanei TaxID=31234 RepID=A0A6A5HHL7_CAERE|nr:hypothetical protein GCK72_007297 [Caenorhabditis remanei]KAF1767338.1 hypothetical protein GCK72_007297 [Caenorhabditis remanei]
MYFYWEDLNVDPLSIPYQMSEISFNTSEKYLSSNLASSSGLGSNIFEVASICGIAKRLKRHPLFFVENGYHKRMLTNMLALLPGLMGATYMLNGTMPTVITKTEFHKSKYSYENPDTLLGIQDEYLFLTGTHYQSWKYFPDMRESLMDYLAVPDPERFGNLPMSNDNTHVTCVHTKRKHFAKNGFYASDPEFIRNALIFINTKQAEIYKKNKKIVIFGDEPIFMSSIFNDSAHSMERHTKTNHYVSINNANDDLIYSKSNCNMVLISAPLSTFGFWLGYLSKGNNVYYMDVTHENEEFYESSGFVTENYFPPHWVALDFASNKNKTVVKSFKKMGEKYYF